MRKWSVIMLALLIIPVMSERSNADDGSWDYVYGDPGPSDYSRYQAVKINPLGGVYLSGFFSGNLEGLSSPSEYRRFLQYRAPDGRVRWTRTIGPGSTRFPTPLTMSVDKSGVVFARVSYMGEMALEYAEGVTIDSEGNQLGSEYEGPSSPFRVLDTISRDQGFYQIRYTYGGPVQLVALAQDLTALWSTALDSWSYMQYVGMVSDGGEGVWVLREIPRPLPTQRDSIEMQRIRADGLRLGKVRHYGLSAGNGSGGVDPAVRILSANKDFVWASVWTEDPSIPMGSMVARRLVTFAFDANDGRLLGPVSTSGPVPLPGMAYDFCGVLGCRYPQLNLTWFAVVAGGRRIYDKGSQPGYIDVYDLVGSTSLVHTLVRRIKVDGLDASNDLVFDADDFGNLVVAGATSGTVIFNPVAVAGKAEPPLPSLHADATVGTLEVPLRAFVARNPGGRIPLKLSPSVPLEIKVTGSNEVPESGVAALSLNVTVTDPASEGFLTVYPCGERRLVSSLNFAKNQTVPNAVFAPVSPQGTICFYAQKPLHLLADVNGWFGAGAGFTPVDPQRVFDTRPGEPALLDVARVPVGGEERVLQVPMTGAGAVPVTGVAAVSLNVTVTNAQGDGFVTVYPCGERKVVSSLNYVKGQTVPNAVITPLSPDGKVCFYAQRNVDLLADVNGWFGTGSGFTPVDPQRVFDTRPGEPALLDVARVPVGGPGRILEVRIAGTGRVPASGVAAVSMNVTVTGARGEGFVTVFPCGVRKEVSSLNFVKGQTVPNAVIAPVSPDGKVCFYANADVDLLADVNGWFASGSGFTPVDPLRVFDTR